MKEKEFLEMINQQALESTDISANPYGYCKNCNTGVFDAYRDPDHPKGKTVIVCKNCKLMFRVFKIPVEIIGLERGRMLKKIKDWIKQS